MRGPEGMGGPEEAVASSSWALPSRDTGKGRTSTAGQRPCPGSCPRPAPCALPKLRRYRHSDFGTQMLLP